MEVPLLDALERYQMEFDGFSLQRIFWLIDRS